MLDPPGRSSEICERGAEFARPAPNNVSVRDIFRAPVVREMDAPWFKGKPGEQISPEAPIPLFRRSPIAPTTTFR
ncbi:MAG: hypothetical protein ACE5IJ_04125 [Thermoplasmata archaeon]